MVEGAGYKVKASGRMDVRSNPILFVLVLVLVLVNRYCVEDEDEHEYDDERGPSDFCALSSVLCYLSSEP